MQPFSRILADLCVVYLVVSIPLGARRYRRLRDAVTTTPQVRTRYYTRLIVVNVSLVLVIGLVALTGAVPLSAFGVRPPYNAVINILVTLYLIMLVILNVVVSSRRLSRMAASGVRRPAIPTLALLPRTDAERNGWLLVSFAVGIGEEITYRGFLTWYLIQLGVSFGVALVVVTLLFGLAHLYQGWQSMLFVTFLGGVFALAYAVTGSLFAPIFFHVLWDARLLWLAPALITVSQEQQMT